MLVFLSIIEPLTSLKSVVLLCATRWQCVHRQISIPDRHFGTSPSATLHFSHYFPGDDPALILPFVLSFEANDRQIWRGREHVLQLNAISFKCHARVHTRTNAFKWSYSETNTHNAYWVKQVLSVLGFIFNLILLVNVNRWKCFLKPFILRVSSGVPRESSLLGRDCLFFLSVIQSHGAHPNIDFHYSFFFFSSVIIYSQREQGEPRSPCSNVLSWTCRSGLTCDNVVLAVWLSGGPLRSIMLLWQSRRLKTVICCRADVPIPQPSNNTMSLEITVPVRYP